VQNTIKLLKEAEIKLWMLTGDKIENSIEIAKLCNLIKHDHCVQFTNKYISQIEDLQKQINLFSQDNIINSKEYYVILDGKTLSYLENLTDLHKNEFMNILTNANSAICCRLTPKQKAKLTRLLKKHCNKVILSVGDGNNDVPMIMEANIGIGICGKEGTQVNYK
jgi:phospholipid-translocating ATPase